MKAYVDRIEDGKMAVIVIKGGGEMIVPVKVLELKVSEGDHLEITITKDEKSKKDTADKIKKLQEELLRKNKKKK